MQYIIDVHNMLATSRPRYRTVDGDVRIWRKNIQWFVVRGENLLWQLPLRNAWPSRSI